MADNLDKELDADILQCRMDILRIRQSITNSRSGEAAAQEVHRADTAAGLKAEIDGIVEPQASQAVGVPVQEPPQQEDSYAVTRDEIDALLNDESTELPEIVERPAQAQEEPAQVIDRSDALFGDEVIVEQVEEYPERADYLAPVFEETPAVAAQPVDENIEADAKAEGGSPVPAEPVESVTNIPRIDSAAQEEQEQVPAEEFPVAEAARFDSPDIEAADSELSQIVAEAEEWMAQIAPEDEGEAVGRPTEEPAEAAEHISAELPVSEEAAEAVTSGVETLEPQQTIAPLDVNIDSPATEPAAGQALVGRFDEVVSELQGEEAILPVEEEAVSAEAGDELRDVHMRIIRDMKDEGQKGDEHRAGIPRLDLSESDVAGILESRKNAAATRKRPGKREKLEIQNVMPETVDDISQEPSLGSEAEVEEAAARLPEAIDKEKSLSLAEKLRMDKEKLVIARIVARDIERFCGGAVKLRQKERAGQR